MTIPRRTAALTDILCDASGALSDLTLALRLIRSIETEGASQPGARLEAHCHPAIAKAAAPYAERLAGKIGARFAIKPQDGLARARFDVRAA